MTTNSRSRSSAQPPEHLFGTALADAALPAIAGSAIRGGSLLGRSILASRAADGAADPAAALAGTRPDALRELARTLAQRPLADDDTALALALYDRARELDPSGGPDLHRALHFRLAVWKAASQGTGFLEQDHRVARLLESAPEDHAAAYAAEAARGDEQAWFTAFRRFAGWDDVVLADDDAALPLLDRLRAAPGVPGTVDGPLISVVMTSHRPGPELITAVRSLMDQSWRNWELLLVDDASGPDHDPILRQAAALDGRVSLLAQTANGGTYRARNRALAKAEGEFTAGLDSDDWAHPRWLETLAAPLLADDGAVMAASIGIRATGDLRLFTGPAQSLAKLFSTPILFRTRPVREKLGYFDVTRKGADTEFRLRLQKTFGARRWVRLEAKHTVVRQSPTSLSGGEVGEGWMHPLRAAYEAGFHHWHRQIQAKRAKPYLADAALDRPFPAPGPLLGAKRTTVADRVYIGDWRYDGPQQRAMLARLEDDAAAGVKVAIAHYESWTAIADRYVPVGNAAVRRAAAAGAEWVDLREIRAEGALAADEAIAAAVAFDFPDAGIGPIEVMPLAAEEPKAPVGRTSPARAAAGRARSLAGRLKRLPRKLLRGKKAALRRGLGKAAGKLRVLRARVRPTEQDLLGVPTAEQRRSLALWTDRLNVGWSAEARAHLGGLARSEAELPALRIAAMEALVDWHEADDRAERRHLELDVVIVSNFHLPGGSSSSNAEEIQAFRRAGLKVGLLHYPIYDWPLVRPVNDKIQRLLEDDGVEWITAHDRVDCDLAIVRFPRIMMRPMDDLPDLRPRRTVLVVNQTPWHYYGPKLGRRLTWDVRSVHRNLTDWLGEHTWYPQGPVVREALLHDHAEEIEGIDLSPDYWYAVLDAAQWRREGRRPGAGPIRIGRHTRDHAHKWPETPEQILACYPGSEDFEVHVLGGANAAKALLRRLPENWTVLPFGSVQPRDFLHRMDVLVFFIADSSEEAFGRTPLEAMAVGLPCVLPRSFEPLFGDGAVYCEPEEVEARVRELMDDPELYAAQSARAVDRVERHYSYDALLDRVATLGVRVPTAADLR
jgi:hypothetical protein